MNKRKAGFLLAVIFLAICAALPACAASDVETRRHAGFFFMESVNSNNLCDYNFMLLCDTYINGSINASFVTIGGSLNVEGSINGVILSLFTKTVSIGYIKYGIINLKFVALPVDFLFGLAAIAVFRDAIWQSAAYFVKNGRGVVKFGLYGYLMWLILIGIYFISVSGAVIAAAFLLALVALTFIGNIPVAVVIGYKLLDKRLKKYNSYILFTAGIIVINVLKLLPLLGDIMAFIIMPLLSLGIFSVHIIHKYFYNAYVFMDFEKKTFDRAKIKSIILDCVETDRRL